MKLWKPGRLGGAVVLGAVALVVMFVGMAGIAHGSGGGGAPFSLVHDRDDHDRHIDRHERVFMFGGAYLGVFLESSEMGGARVAKVVEGSPAGSNEKQIKGPKRIGDPPSNAANSAKIDWSSTDRGSFVEFLRKTNPTLITGWQATVAVKDK